MKSCQRNGLSLALTVVAAACQFLHAVPLPPVISCNHLHGTNGFVIVPDNDAYFGNQGVSFVRDINGDTASEICIAAYPPKLTVLVSEPANHRSKRLINSFDGTNGFYIQGLSMVRDGRTPENWPAGSFISAIDYLGMQQLGMGCCTLLKLEWPVPSYVMTSTDEWWKVSYRLYSSVWQPEYRCAMIGNFYTGRYAMAYRTQNGFAVLGLATLTNAAVEVDTNSPYAVNLTTTSVPVGWWIAGTGDVNSDGIDDLLCSDVSIWSNFWIIYGGRGLRAEQLLSSLTSNAVRVCPGYNDAYVVPPPMVFPASVGDPMCALGDLNGDGLDDIGYYEEGSLDGTLAHWGKSLTCIYGMTNWPQAISSAYIDDYRGFRIFALKDISSHPSVGLAGRGDVNGDGHNDIVYADSSSGYVFYGGPTIHPDRGWSVNGTNGFLITDIPVGEWCYVAVDGDANADDYDDVLLASGSASYATNYAWLIYGGQSPSTPPALRTPLWINVGQSATLDVQYTDLPTNVLWMGCKKDDDYTFCQTNGAACPAWDVPMGVLYFTNSVALTSTSQVLTVSYTSTNALGSAAGATTLVLQPLPEPLRTGVVVMAGALLTKLLR